VLRIFLISFFLLPVDIIADALLSSPKLSLNAKGERVIEFKIQNRSLSDQDIILKEYKSDELITQKKYFIHTPRRLFKLQDIFDCFKR